MSLVPAPSSAHPDSILRSYVWLIAVIGILVFINFLSLKNNREYDLTKTGEFTLSEQTIDVLASMKEPVQIIGFFRAGDHRWQIAQDNLKRFSGYTDQLTYKFHDPAVEPTLAQSYKFHSYGLVFVSGIKRYEALEVDEQTITNGLIYVTSSKQKTGEEQPLNSIASKAPSNHHLYLTPLQTGFTLFTTLIVIPLTIFFAGLGIWWSRR